MKQIVNIKNGGYNVLEVQEAPDPEPGADEVLIAVKASGLNFADILARKGIYPDAPSKPCVMGYEVAGTVEAVGEDVDSIRKGEHVIAMTRFKGQAEKVLLKPKQIYKKPQSLSFEEAAAIPVNYLTAYVLIVVMGSLQDYESILIHNAGGGVGLAALDIARHVGATTYGTASQRKHELLNERGLDYAIDYRNKDWYEELMKLTNNRGVDLITDPLGGREWKRSYKALRATGRLGMFGISTASKSFGAGLLTKLRLLKTFLQMPFFHPSSMLNKNRGAFGVNLGHLWHEPEKAAIWTQRLLDGVAEGWINPRVDKVFEFSEIREAHYHIESRKNIGKVILVP